MRDVSEMHGYQDEAQEREVRQSRVGAFIDMGLGKTVITETAISRLIRSMFASSRALVVAPKRVAEIGWAAEQRKWRHLQGLSVAHIDAAAIGLADVWVTPSREGLPASAPDPAPQRVRQFGDKRASRAALMALAHCNHVCTVSYDFYPYLVALMETNWPWDIVVLDESVFVKSPSSLRFRAAKHMMRTQRVERLVLLSGRPRPNGLEDLWAQAYLLDGGKRLGDTMTEFRRLFMEPVSFDYVRGGKRIATAWAPRTGATDAVNKLMGEISFSMKASDWLQLPPVVTNRVMVTLPPLAREQYDRLKREAQLILPTGDVVRLEKAGNKLLQIANGNVYDSERNAHHVHDAKLDAVEEIVESLNGEPLLLTYSFKPDLAKLRERFGKRLRAIDDKDAKEGWRRGEFPIFAMHAAQGAHGVDWMQEVACNLLWYGPTYNRDHWDQLNARLARQGQRAGHVIANVVMAADTLDEHVLGVCDDKGIEQDVLMAALRAHCGAVQRGEPVSQALRISQVLPSWL